MASPSPPPRLLPHPVQKLAISPDGRLAATAAGQEVRLWEMARGKPFGQPLRHEGSVFALEFPSDGNVLITGLWGSSRLCSAGGLPGGSLSLGRGDGPARCSELFGQVHGRAGSSPAPPTHH